MKRLLLACAMIAGFAVSAWGANCIITRTPGCTFADGQTPIVDTVLGAAEFTLPVKTASFAGGWVVDGTQCTATTLEIAAGAPRRRAVTCTSSSAGTLDMSVMLPKGFNTGALLTLRMAAINNNAAPTGLFTMGCKCVCKAALAVDSSASWGSPTNISWSFGTQYAHVISEITLATCGGSTCAGGVDASIRCSPVTGSTTTQTADTYFIEALGSFSAKASDQ